MDCLVGRIGVRFIPGLKVFMQHRTPCVRVYEEHVVSYGTNYSKRAYSFQQSTIPSRAAPFAIQGGVKGGALFNQVSP